MLTAGCTLSACWRRRAVGGDLLVWNGDDDNGVRLGLEAFAFAALIVSFNAALPLAIDAVPSALALSAFAGEAS